MNHAQVAQTGILFILGEYLVYLEAIWHVFGVSEVAYSAIVYSVHSLMSSTSLGHFSYGGVPRRQVVDWQQDSCGILPLLSLPRSVVSIAR